MKYFLYFLVFLMTTEAQESHRRVARVDTFKFKFWFRYNLLPIPYIFRIYEHDTFDPDDLLAGPSIVAAGGPEEVIFQDDGDGLSQFYDIYFEISFRTYNETDNKIVKLYFRKKTFRVGHDYYVNFQMDLYTPNPSFIDRFDIIEDPVIIN